MFELSLLFLIPVALIVLGFMTFFVEIDRPLTATAVLLGFGVALEFLTTIHPFTAIYENPGAILGYLAVYLGIGVVYGVVKWYRFLRNLVAEYAERRRDYLRQRKLDESKLTEQEKRAMVEYLAARIVGHGRSIPPKVSEHKSRVTTWMAYWPLSLTWMLLDDLVIGIWNWTYTRIADLLQGLSNRIFAQFKTDFVK